MVKDITVNNSIDKKLDISDISLATPAHLIEVHDLVKSYHTPAGDVPALRGINMYVDAGEFLTIVGKSGAGKSTLINMLTGTRSSHFRRCHCRRRINTIYVGRPGCALAWKEPGFRVPVFSTPAELEPDRKYHHSYGFLQHVPSG